MTPVKGYSEMKDSGIPWIGMIPEHWKLNRLKWVLSERNEKNDPIKTKFILSLGANYGIVPYAEKEGGGNKAKEDVSAYKIACPNDIVMNSMNIISGSVGLSKYYGCVSPVYYMFYPRDEKETSVKYYYDLFQTIAFQRSLLGLGNGILIKESSNGTFNTVRMRIPISKLNNIEIPIPPFNEQSAIAAYLDEKCSKIDEIIASAKASIEDYKQWKASIIYEAITKGLDPDAEMKDSGIEWIGKIPKEWKISKIKTILENVSIKNHPDAEVLSLYRDLGVLPKNSRDDNHNVTSEDTAQYKFVEVGNLVINKMKAWQGSLAVSSYEGIVSPAYYVCRFRNNSMKKRYIHYLLRCKVYAQEFEKLSTGMRIGQWDLGIKDFMGIPVLIPPIEEQNRIAEYIDATCSTIDILTQEKEHLIVDLESYKKSLIYEAVTGKRKVC